MCQTYKIAICDDLATDRKYLSSLCEIWSRHNCYRIQISEFTSAENFLFHYAEKKDFDILLLRSAGKFNHEPYILKSTVF